MLTLLLIHDLSGEVSKWNVRLRPRRKKAHADDRRSAVGRCGSGGDPINRTATMDSMTGGKASPVPSGRLWKPSRSVTAVPRSTAGR